MKKNIQTPYEYLKAEIEKSIPSRFKNQKELAEATGIAQGNLSDFLSGKRAGMNFETAYKILEVLGLDFEGISDPKPKMKRPDTFSPIETIEGENLINVDVCEFAGAGSEVSYDSFKPVHSIQILPAYHHQNLKVIQILGDSMSPTIEDNSYVGVVPCGTNLYEGKIYLVSRPPFGLMVKRVFTSEQKEIVLRSDNKEHKDIVIPYEGYEDIVIGRVVWVWQNV